MYKIFIRPILFLFTPETVHAMVFGVLRITQKIRIFNGLVKILFYKKHQLLEKEVFGIKFPNPVGLAAGLDKDGEVADILGFMGFGFVEVGTITPKAQPGNDKPRLFRLKQDKALINRMGFNNKGVEYLSKNIKQKYSKVIVGGNIGKNKITPNENATDDYIYCFEQLHNSVDYFAVNVSSPNTPNLRELQEKEPLKKLLKSLVSANSQKAVKKPILLKIAPDLSNSQLDDIIEIVNESGIDGIIATNTTIERKNLKHPAEKITAIGAGGLSGLPLKNRSTEVIKYLYEKSQGKIPIVAVGGIFTAKDAIEKLEAGASLVQIYTGFIYEGPAVVKKINKGLIEYYKHKNSK